MDEFAEKASRFYTDVFTLEWKKMVLPVIMVLALSVSAYSTLDLRDSPESEQRMELSVETMTNISAVHLKKEYFNDSVNKTQRQLGEEISQQAQRRQKQLTSGTIRTKAQIAHIQKLGLFPYTPELYVPVQGSREDTVGALALVHYRQEQFTQLDERLNSSENMSLEEFNSEVQRIRDTEYRDEEVQNYFENNSLNENTGLGTSTVTGEIENKITQENIRPLTFTSYLPAILATFLLYYVVNALAVETGRKAYTQVKEHEKQQDEETGEKDSEEDEKTGEEKEENRE